MLHKGKLLVLTFVFSIIAAVTAVFTFFVLGTGTASAVSEGEGTQGSPYKISTAEELCQVAQDVNAGLYDGYYGVYFVLTGEIDLTALINGLNDIAGWPPIGTVSYPFKGSFDGAGHAIKGLMINRADEERVGLFGVTGVNATVKNLSVYGFVHGGNYTSGIAGYNLGRIENCKNLAAVTAKSNSLHIGGVAAYNAGKIVNSSNEGSFSLGFATFAGGITGSNFGIIENCYNTADLDSAASIIGGIAGLNSQNATVSGTVNTGIICGKSTIGGITGNNQGTVSNAFNAGLIDSDNGTAAGIAGSNEVSGDISFAVNASEVLGFDDIAAVCGYNLGTVSCVFYDNDVFGGSIVNGIAAENSNGLSTHTLTHSDVLTNPDKLKLLTDGNTGFWVKRAYTDFDCYYPELKYFHDGAEEVSKVAARISRKELTQNEVSLSVTEFVYNGQYRESDVYLDAVKLEEGQDYTSYYKNNKNAGTAVAELTFINGFSGLVNKTFTITQSELEVGWSHLQFIYNGGVQVPVLTIIDGLIGEETVTFVYDNINSKDTGFYEIGAELAATEINANYSLAETSAQYEILKAEITVNWSDENFYYNGEVQVPSASVQTGRIGDEQITFLYSFNENINAGQQQISVHLKETQVNRNYAFLGDTHYYLINKQPISVSWSDASELLYYNGFAQYPAAEVLSGRIGAEEITFSYSGYENNIDADESGGYLVSINLSATPTNANYLLEQISHNYKIYKNPVGIAWWDVPLIYTGFAQYPGFYIEYGRIGGEEIAFEVSDYTQNVNASTNGAYKIEIFLSANTINANYRFEPVTKTYDILKAQFTFDNVIFFRSQTFAYDGQAKSIYISGTLPEGITVSYENNGKKEAGEHRVAAKFYADINNYKPLSVDTLTAVMYIARMSFEYPECGISVLNRGEAVYGLDPELKTLDSSPQLKERGKKVLSAYSINFLGTAEVNLLLTKEIAKSKNIKVLYKNLDGNIITAEFKSEGSSMVFTAEDITEFYILADKNYLTLWLGLAGFAVFIMILAAVLIIKRKFAVDIIPVKTIAADKDDSMTNVLKNILVTESILRFVNNSRQLVPKKDTAFILDGIKCASYEWFVKSLNYRDEQIQRRVCKGDGEASVLAESKSVDLIFWQGKRYKINSRKFVRLLTRAERATYEKS